MELFETILKRRSTRVYNGQPIPEETLHSILEAGLLAPSSRNLYPVEFVVVQNRDTLTRLSKVKKVGSTFLKNAAAAIVTIGDSDRADTWIEDCAIAMTFMQLRATELGVASCWVQCRDRISQQPRESGPEGGYFTADEWIRQCLRIPPNYTALSILSLGLSERPPVPHTPQDAHFTKVHKEHFD